MHSTIGDVMTPNPQTISPNASIMDAACMMRDHSIGDVVVAENGRLIGIVTDRDIVVRALAEKCDPYRTTVADVCSREMVTLTPESGVGEAVRLMRERAIRRLPIEQDGRVVGILTIGDVAIDADRRSALADISAAPPNA